LTKSYLAVLFNIRRKIKLDKAGKEVFMQVLSKIVTHLSFAQMQEIVIRKIEDTLKIQVYEYVLEPRGKSFSRICRKCYRLECCQNLPIIENRLTWFTFRKDKIILDIYVCSICGNCWTSGELDNGKG
jgi:hypothetical protein